MSEKKNTMQTVLTQQISILLSEIDPNHFISKRNFCKAAFEMTIDYSRKNQTTGVEDMQFP